MAPGLHTDAWRGHEKVSNDQFWYENISVPCLADVGVSHGVGDGSRTPPRSMERVWIKFQITNFTMPNNVSSMIYALKSVPSLADVGFPMGTGMARELHPDVRRGSWKSFKWQPNNVSSVKYALKSVPGLADVGVPYGDGPRIRIKNPGIPRWSMWKPEEVGQLKGCLKAKLAVG